MKRRVFSLVVVLGAMQAVDVVLQSEGGSVGVAQARRRRNPPTKTAAPAPPGGTAVPDNPFDAAASTAPASAQPAGTAAPASAAPATAAPAPEEPPPIPEPTPREDLSGIEDEYHRIVDEIFQARTRVSALGAQLYSTKVRVRVQDRTTRTQALQRIRLLLDGDAIFSGDASFRAEDGRQVYDGFAAPGAHVVGVEVEYRSRENDRYVYRLHDAYTFEVIKGRLTEIRVLLEEDSNIAEDFPDDREGEYDVRSRIRIEAAE